VWGVWGTFDIPQTALVATLDTYDFYKSNLIGFKGACGFSFFG
jgi:hypothetical protein